MARLDYGADITTIPFEILEKLNLSVAGYNDSGEVQLLFNCTLQLRYLTFKGIDVIATSTPYVLLGLDILNTLHICLNGHKKQFEIIEKHKKK